MPQASISDLCHHLWSEHTQQITNHITKSSINQLQSTFEGAIFHCEDKHASSLRIYCPCLYYQSIESTFQDPSIFEQLPDEPSSIVASLVESLHHQHGKAYPWAVGSGQQLPAGYILAKRKKDFFGADDPSYPSLNLPFDRCSTSLLGSSFNLSRPPVPTTLPQGICTLCCPFCAKHLSMLTSFLSTRIWQVSSPALTKKDLFDHGSCSWTSFVRRWMCTMMKFSPFIQGNPTILVTSSKDTPFVVLISLGRLSSNTFQIWLSQRWTCKPLPFANDVSANVEGVPWATLSHQPFA